ncbi:MAG TPA: efflux RND transporter periplasmic adaptor subunit [Phycisphaerales bacterium]|nr:efflux RND transporter periplasmic adaptor subunit [Phycisphaerales bacterium]
MKRSRIIAGVTVITLVVVLAATVALVRRGQDEKAKNAPPTPEPAEAVTIAPAAIVTWRPTADLVGTVLAVQSVTVSNEVEGRVEEVNFISGQEVQAGDVLLKLDDAMERADLAAAEASIRVGEADVKVAEARIRLEEANVRRLTQATERGAASQADLDQARANFDEANASMARARAEVDHARARADQVRVTIGKKMIRAPFRALAGMRTVHPGQYLGENTPVVMLQGVADEIFLDFAVPQDQLFRVNVGATVMASIPMFGAEPVPVKVVSIDATANPDTRNVRIRSVVRNPGGLLRPGMSVDVRVPIDEEREYVAIPPVAARRASYGDHVFVVQSISPEEMRAKQRFVKLGPTIGGSVLVLEGLEPGERVAAQGSFKLRDGAKVFEAPPEGAQGAPPAESGAGGAGGH